MLNNKEFTCLNKIFAQLYQNENYEKVFNDYLENLKELVPFEVGDIYFCKSDSDQITFENFIFVGWGEQHLDSYLHQYCAIDDALPLVSSKQPVMFRSSDVFLLDERIKTKYYNELIIPASMDYSIEGNLYVGDDNYVGGIGIHRPEEYGDFTDKELEILRLSRPHLSNIARKFQESRDDFDIHLTNFPLLSNIMELGVCIWDFDLNLVEHNLGNSELAYADHIEEIIRSLNALCKNLRKIITLNKNTEENRVKSRIIVGDASYFAEVTYTNSNKKDITKGEFIGTVYDYSIIFSKVMRELKDTYSLTDREYEVLDCMLQGMTNMEISKKIFISVPTVKKHLTNIYSKMNIEGKHQIFHSFF